MIAEYFVQNGRVYQSFQKLKKAVTSIVQAKRQKKFHLNNQEKVKLKQQSAVKRRIMAKNNAKNQRLAHKI